MVTNKKTLKEPVAWEEIKKKVEKKREKAPKSESKSISKRQDDEPVMEYECTPANKAANERDTTTYQYTQQQQEEDNTYTLPSENQPTHFTSENQSRLFSSENQRSSLASENQRSSFHQAPTGAGPKSTQKGLALTGAALNPLHEEDWGPEKSAIILLRELKSGALDPKDLDINERRVVVKNLRDAGRTQDEIAALLAITRRTIVNDCKWLREQAAREIQGHDLYEIAGEVAEVGRNCIMGAIKEGKWRTASYVMRDMVELLQSLGVVYKAPAQAKLAAVVGHGQLQQGYRNYMDKVAPESDAVVGVLNDLMSMVAGDETPRNRR